MTGIRLTTCARYKGGTKSAASTYNPDDFWVLWRFSSCSGFSTKNLDGLYVRSSTTMSQLSSALQTLGMNFAHLRILSWPSARHVPGSASVHCLSLQLSWQYFTVHCALFWWWTWFDRKDLNEVGFTTLKRRGSQHHLREHGIFLFIKRRAGLDHKVHLLQEVGRAYSRKQ